MAETIAQLTSSALRVAANARTPLDKPTCGGTKTDAGKLFRCSKCSGPRYCGPDCQVKGWKAGHKEECRRIREDVERIKSEVSDMRERYLEFDEQPFVKALQSQMPRKVDPIPMGKQPAAVEGGRRIKPGGGQDTRHNYTPQPQALHLAKYDVHARTFDGETPLHAVSQVGPDFVACMRLLLAHGADPNALDDSQITPLACAAHENCANVARVLLDGGTDPDLADYRGRLPIHKTFHKGIRKMLAEASEAKRRKKSEDVD
ncbi:ankyrin repeat-containing domain protein [Hyaloraphidium curvatum]|nr:ankyrin repeat-containing domain protein [Hyaloraphidium curvatum]